MLKHSEQRVGVFVDTANMYHSAKNIYKANVNFGEILQEVVDGRKLIRAIAYVVKSEGDQESSFFDALDKQGFEVKQKDLQVFAGGMKKADVDVDLAVDTIKLADKLDSIIIISGDGDYTPLVTYLKENKGCLVEIAAFGQTTSSKLVAEADDFLDLSEDVNRFLLGTKKTLRRKSTTRATKTTKAAKPTKAAAGPKKKRRVIF